MQHAIWAGDEVTGATTFRIVKEIDAGPTYGVMTERIRPTDTAGDLLARLAEGGAGLLVATLDGIEDGSLEARPQQAEDGVSFAPKITVEDAHVDWAEPAVGGRPPDPRLHARRPAPGRRTTGRGSSSARSRSPTSGWPPGELRVGKAEVLVGTATTAVRLGEVKAFGAPADAGRRLGARAPAAGRRPFRFRRACRRGRVAWVP